MKMLLSAPVRIIAVALLCVAALIGLVLHEAAARMTGAEVIMRMQAVDPRALLSGHYVVLNLQETLPAGGACPASLHAQDGPRFGPHARGAWVALKPNGAFHSVAGSAETREAALALGPLAARGSAFCTPARAPTEGDGGFAGALSADLGVSRFHIEQRQAEWIERLMRDAAINQEGRVSAILAIGRDGRARLKGLLVDGQRYELTWI